MAYSDHNEKNKKGKGKGGKGTKYKKGMIPSLFSYQALLHDLIVYSQASLVSKLLKQIAKAWKAERGYR